MYSIRFWMIRILVVLIATSIWIAEAQVHSEPVLTNAIMGFAHDQPRSVSLGSYNVVDSDNVRIVLSYKERGVPALIYALSDKNPLIVAQSAYCLEVLKAKQAISEVKKAREKFDNLWDHPEPSEEYASKEYARERLEGYLRAAKNDFRE